MRTCEHGTCNKPAEFREKKMQWSSNHNNAYCGEHKEIVQQQNNMKDEEFVQLVPALAKAA